MALTDKLTAIADAIRGKTGKTDGLTLDAMPEAIEGIQTGGGDSGGLKIVRGTATVTSSNNIIQHNAGIDNYIWHAWVDELPTEGSNNAVEYLYYSNPGKNVPKFYHDMGVAIRYNPSTGVFSRSSGSPDSSKVDRNNAPLGNSYAAHSTVIWNWEVIGLDGYTQRSML